jgi:hypothetical protein
VKRFAAFEDSALMERLTRLARTEAELQERIENRMRQAELEGRWVPSDPIYQQLASALKQVRSALRETEQEHLTRMTISAAGVFAGA